MLCHSQSATWVMSESCLCHELSSDHPACPSARLDSWSPGPCHLGTTSAVTGSATIRPCSQGRYCQGIPAGGSKSSSTKMENHLFPFSIADSAKVSSKKQCAEFGSAPASCANSGSHLSYYRA